MGGIHTRLTESQGIEELTINKRPDWVPDEATTVCRKCDKHFNGLRRRHHCRACGQLFCSHCVGLGMLGSLGYKGPVLQCHVCMEQLLHQFKHQISTLVLPRTADTESDDETEDALIPIQLNYSPSLKVTVPQSPNLGPPILSLCRLVSSSLSSVSPSPESRSDSSTPYWEGIN